MGSGLAVYPQLQGSDCISRTQSDRRERRNKEIGSSQALGSSAGLTRRPAIGSVRPEIAATQGCVGFHRNDQSADTARHSPTGYLPGMHVCTLRRVLCASETQKAAVSAVSRGTRRSRIELYAAGPRKQRMASLRMEGKPRCPMSVAARRLSFIDRCDDRHAQQRQVVFIRCPRQRPPNQASVCANAKGSNSVPSARVKPTRSYYEVGYAADAACLVSITWRHSEHELYLLGLY
jgi:hypothetical protein